MSLSDKMRELELFTSEGIPVIIHKLFNLVDVKQAVKELKEEIKPYDAIDPFILYSDVCKKIDKKFGERLI